MTPSSLQNQYRLGGSYLPSLATSPRYNLGPLWITASGGDSQETLPRFHLSDAGLFLTTANVSAQAEQRCLFNGTSLW